MRDSLRMAMAGRKFTLATDLQPGYRSPVMNPGTGLGPGRALILLDVDGVLNPAFSSSQRSRLWHHDGWRHAQAWSGGREYPLFLNPEHGRWLRDVAAEASAELAWASTWENLANQYVGPVLGLPPLAFAPAPLHHKARSVVEWTAGRPFAWLDDSEAELAQAGRLAAGQPHLCVLVDESTGLTQEHLSQVRAWLQALPDEPPGQLGAPGPR
jgi:hypothetical protein